MMHGCWQNDYSMSGCEGRSRGKGVNFVNLRDAGDPVELAALYDQEGADELVFLDISASVEGRATMVECAPDGGGNYDSFHGWRRHLAVDDMKRLLARRRGQNRHQYGGRQQSAADLRRRAQFGSQCIVVAIDAKYNAEWGEWEVYTHGGRKATGIGRWNGRRKRSGWALAKFC